MKFRITMKDPNGYDESIDEAANIAFLTVDEVDDGIRKFVVRKKREELEAKAEKWFKWHEYLTVEIDTDADTCVVVAPK